MKYQTMKAKKQFHFKLKKKKNRKKLCQGGERPTH